MHPRISIGGSVHPSVRPSVRPSVHPSVSRFFKSRKSRGNDIESLENKIWQILQINLTNLTNLSDKSILVPNFRHIFVRTNLLLYFVPQMPTDASCLMVGTDEKSQQILLQNSVVQQQQQQQPQQQQRVAQQGGDGNSTLTIITPCSFVATSTSNSIQLPTSQTNLNRQIGMQQNLSSNSRNRLLQVNNQPKR